MELIRVETQRRIQILKAKQAKELSDLENSQLEELSLFNQQWDQRMLQLQNQGQTLQQDLGSRHANECEDLRQNFLAAQSPPKGNPELLNLIEMRKKMVKTRRYADADMASQRIEEIKESLNKEWNAKEKAKLEMLMGNLKKKHAMEMQGLKIRVENGIGEEEKVKAKELDKLLQKYQNLRRC